MLYKITGSNCRIASILDMLRYCNGTLESIKINKKVDGKLRHVVKYKPYFQENGKLFERNYTDMLRKNNLWVLSDEGTIIRDIVVKSNNIAIERWKSFCYEVTPITS